MNQDPQQVSPPVSSANPYMSPQPAQPIQPLPQSIPPAQPMMPQPSPQSQLAQGFFQPGAMSQPVQQIGAAPAAQPAIATPAVNYVVQTGHPGWMVPALVTVLVLVVLGSAGLCAAVFLTMK